MALGLSDLRMKMSLKILLETFNQLQLTEEKLTSRQLKLNKVVVLHSFPKEVVIKSKIKFSINIFIVPRQWFLLMVQEVVMIHLVVTLEIDIGRKTLIQEEK